jgi:hypothetical protein
MLRTTRRPAFSLTEVLVALFVMAIGIISLLTLFPVGAVQMGHALRDDRAHTTAIQADAYLRLWWQQKVLQDETPTPPVEPVWVALKAADPTANPAPIPNAGTLLAYGGLLPVPQAPVPSYPVLFDPIGWQARPAGSWQQSALAGTVVPPPTQYPIPTNGPMGSAILRRSSTLLAATGTFAPSFRACSLLDDIEYGPDGYPADTNQTGAADPVVRNGRYNWAAVVQQPNVQNPTTADLKILVFERRTPGVAPADAEAAYTIGPATANVLYPPFQVGSTQVVIPDVLDNLKIRVNGWIMDGTVSNDPTSVTTAAVNTAAGTVTMPVHVGIRNAQFYRIQAITEDPANNRTIVELNTPIRPPTGGAGVGGLQSYNGRLYILNNLIEVFDRPPLTPSKYLPQTP